MASGGSSSTATPILPHPPSTSSPVKPEFPTPSTPCQRPPLPTDVDAVAVHIPSYARWFSWKSIHECEVRFVPEFFESRSASKNPRTYMYYRNSIIKHFRRNPSSKLTFTDVRKILVGDVGSIRRVFDFLDSWGLINYTPSALNKPLKWEDKDSNKSASNSAADGGAASTDSTPSKKDNSKRLCSSCQSLCSIACFVCDKYDLTLCARCYVRGNYRVGVSCSDFRRVEISEEIRAEWTEKETLQLLEAVTNYGDDWKKVALHVPGRSEKECVAHFIKLPCGEEFAGYTELGELNSKYDCSDSECRSESIGSSSINKRIRLTPLADASNPIMGQAAFLSALAGTEVAEAAARAAVTTLMEAEDGASKGRLGSLSRNTRQGAGVSSNGGTNPNSSERASFNVNSLPEKEELDAERVISRIIEVEMKEIQDKLDNFEELDLLMEKEWQQLEQIKNLLFVDQLAFLFHKKSTPKTVEHAGEIVRTD